MKPKSLLTLRHDTLATAIGFLLASAALPASAGTIYWDGTAASPGSWDALANWSTDIGLALPDPLIKPGAADDVVFNINGMNANQTIHLNATAQAANSLTFNSTGTTVINRAVATSTSSTALTVGTGGLTVGASAGQVSIGSGADSSPDQRVAYTMDGSSSITHNGAAFLTLARGVITAATAGPTSTTLTFDGSGTGITEMGAGLAQGTNSTLSVNVNTTNTGILYFRTSSSNTGNFTITQGRVAVRGNGAFGTGTLIIKGGQISAVSTIDRGHSGNTTIEGDFTLGGLTIPANPLTGAGALGTRTFFFGGPVDLAGGTRTITTAGSGGRIDGVVSNGGLTVAGTAGTLALTATNTYTGLTTVSGSTLRLGHATDTLSGAITVSGGTLNVDNPDTVGAVTLTSGTISGDSALTGTSYAVESGTVSTVLAGSGVTLTKTTSGTVTLSGTNTYDGLTIVSNGTLTLGHATDTLSGAITVSGGTLNVDNPDTVGAVTLTSGTISGDSALTATSYDFQNGTVSAALAGSGAAVTKTTGDWVVVSNSDNNYGGGTFLNAGRLGLRASNSLGTGTLTINGGTIGSVVTARSISNQVVVNSNFQIGGVNAPGLGNADTTFHGAMDLTGATRTITLASGATINGIVSNGGLDVVSSGSARTLNLGGANSYSGATSVGANVTLAITSTGSINTTSGISVAAGGTLRYNSSTTLTVAPSLNGTGTGSGQRAILGGTGPINATVTLDNLGDVLSPGNSPGTQTYTTGQSWASFSYDWELNNFTGTTAGTHFDQIGITGTLDLTGGSGNYILNVLGLTAGNAAGLVTNFSEINRSWTILTSAGITGFNSTYWTINTAGFTNPNTGTWSLARSGNDLVLSYAPIPEPRAALLGSLGMLMLLRRRRA